MSEDVSGDKTKSNSIQDNYDYNNIDKLNGQVGLKGEVKDNIAISPDKKAAEKDFSKVRMKPILKQRKVDRIESNSRCCSYRENLNKPR